MRPNQKNILNSPKIKKSIDGFFKQSSPIRFAGQIRPWSFGKQIDFIPIDEKNNDDDDNDDDDADRN